MHLEPSPSGVCLGVVRKYVPDAEAQNLLVFYRLPPEPSEPPLRDIRIGGQHRLR